MYSNRSDSILQLEENTSFYNSPMYGKMFGTFSSSFEGFYKKWEPNQNFDENLSIQHIGQFDNSGLCF